MADAAGWSLPRIEHIQITLPTADVDTLAFLVPEPVVCIAAELNVEDPCAVSFGERGKSCGISERHHDVARLGIQRHREIGPVAQRPTAQFFLRVTIRDDDCLAGWIVEEDLVAAGIELKAFRMGS